MQHEKDLYAVLQVSPQATAQEIKKAFRQLAMRYHPDSNRHDPLANQKFQQLKAAYDILIDKKKRAQYHFERSLQQKPAARPSAISFEELWKRAKATNNSIKASDPFRVDRDAVLFEIQRLLTSDHIGLIQKTAAGSIQRKNMYTTILDCCMPLSFESKQIICNDLSAIDPTDLYSNKLITDFIRQEQWATYWEKYKTAAALITAIIVCMAIYLMTK